MNKILLGLFFIISFVGAKDMNLYDIEVKTIEGQTIKLDKYKNKVMLIINVASKCGFTNQYEGLEKLYEKYKKEGLAVLGFPCNQFLSQEPGTEKEIQSFCSLTYGVKFDMFSKIDVNGDDTHPLYTFLKENSSGFLGTDIIKWNFTKFLVNKEGKVFKRYSPSTTPAEIEEDIKGLL
jgi:glutathione peroxidase